jgi:hypothetical protein
MLFTLFTRGQSQNPSGAKMEPRNLFMALQIADEHFKDSKMENVAGGRRLIKIIFKLSSSSPARNLLKF